MNQRESKQFIKDIVPPEGYKEAPHFIEQSEIAATWEKKWKAISDILNSGSLKNWTFTQVIRPHGNIVRINIKLKDNEIFGTFMFMVTDSEEEKKEYEKLITLFDLLDIKEEKI